MREYRAEDWPRARCHPECAYWDAVGAWTAANPDRETPIGAGPDTPFHREMLE